MIFFPPAKINLGLKVLHKREDSYHELDTCMVPIPLFDVLELLPSSEFSFQQTGLTIPGNSVDNLCVRAYELMRNTFKIPPVYMHLRKQIPMGAGMGGGSSDAAYVLLGLKELFSIQCSQCTLEELAGRLGSDCPFFIKNEAQIAKGRGEVLSPCQLDLKGYYLKIVNPGIHIGTKEAYEGIVFDTNKSPVQSIVEGPISLWKNALKNDFETSVFKLYPKLEQIKEGLYSEGAIYAAMSGSGSTLFGIFKNEPQKSFANLPQYSEYILKF